MFLPFFIFVFKLQVLEREDRDGKILKEGEKVCSSGWACGPGCVQQAAVVNGKLQPLPTYKIRNRICFRAKPPARRSWRSYPCSGVPTPGSAVICCATCGWEEGEGDAWEFAQVSSKFKCNSNWSQGSAQCQLACCADGTFWSSSTFIQASRDAVNMFGGEYLFLLSSVVSQPCLQIHTGVSWEQNMLWAPRFQHLLFCGKNKSEYWDQAAS